jgi:hypothetical protein
LLDEEIIKQASEGVLHYFKSELGKTSVTISEFSAALEHALRALGLQVSSPDGKDSKVPETPRVVRSDLAHLAGIAEQGFELMFFGRLRSALLEVLEQSPDIVHFRGLRPCVKQLLQAKRWSAGCQQLNDQIVDFLRSCFDSQRRSTDCALLVY